MAHEIIGALVKAADLLRDAGVDYQIRASADDGASRVTMASNAWTPEEPEANLGLATTEQLLTEIKGRYDGNRAETVGEYVAGQSGRPSALGGRIQS